MATNLNDMPRNSQSKEGKVAVLPVNAVAPMKKVISSVRTGGHGPMNQLADDHRQHTSSSISDGTAPTTGTVASMTGLWEQQIQGHRNEAAGLSETGNCMDSSSRVKQIATKFEKASKLGMSVNHYESTCEIGPMTTADVFIFHAHPTPHKKARLNQSEANGEVSIVAEVPALQPPHTTSPNEFLSTAPKPAVEVLGNYQSTLGSLFDEVMECALETTAIIAKFQNMAAETSNGSPEEARTGVKSWLSYTVTQYRKRGRPDVKSISSRSIDFEKDTGGQSGPGKSETVSNTEYQARLEWLGQKIAEKKTQIYQLCLAENFWKEKRQFRTSAEVIEIEKNLLIAVEQVRCFIEEKYRIEVCHRNRSLMNPAPPLGTLTIFQIAVQLQRSFIDQPFSHEVHYFICILQYRDALHATRMLSTDDVTPSGDLVFINYVQFKQLPPDFEVVLKVFTMRTFRDQLTNNESDRITLGKQRSLSSLLDNPNSARSPGGLGVVADVAFRLVGGMVITRESASTSCVLRMTDISFPAEGTVRMEASCVPDEIRIESEQGFLNCYEEVGGVGTWNRFWSSFVGDKIKFWKFPQDEDANKRPIFTIDLATCISHQVGPAPTEITARPNAFFIEMYDAVTGDRSSFMFAMDSKHEAVKWCKKLDTFLYNSRLWSIGGN